MFGRSRLAVQIGNILCWAGNYPTEVILFHEIHSTRTSKIVSGSKCSYSNVLFQVRVVVLSWQLIQWKWAWNGWFYFHLLFILRSYSANLNSEYTQQVLGGNSCHREVTFLFCDSWVWVVFGRCLLSYRTTRPTHIITLIGIVILML